DRAIAANAVRQRQQLDRGVVCERRQQAKHGGDVLLVTCDQVALEPAIGALAEDVEGGAAQASHPGQQLEYRQHPGPEGTFPGPPQRVFGPAKQWRREIEADLEIAIELVAQLLFE